MANARRSKLKPWKTKPIQVTLDPQLTLTQGTLPALPPNIASTSARSTDIATGKLARLKNLLRFSRSNRTIAGASISPPQPTCTVDQVVAPTTCVRDEIDATTQELDVLVPASCVTQHAAELVGEVNTSASQINTLSSTYLQSLKTFNNVVSTISNVHPYTQMALGVLTGAAQVIIGQANLDYSVSSLLSKVRSVYEFLLEEDTKANLDTMKDTLAHIAQVVSSCAQFIENYSEIKNLWQRVAKSIVFETQFIVDEYNKVLDGLMQEFRDHTVCDTSINVPRVLDIFEDLNLDGMAYTEGAGPDTTKKCMDGTRVEILKEIVDWINDPDVNVPRIFWLHGQAGRGKSAIAHTVALEYKNAGGLCACFCFARDRQAERREEKMLSTIVRDLANHDPAFRRALVRAVKDDNMLKATRDVIQQWERLLKPLSKVSGGSVGNVVVVIDALDESRLDASRKHILEVLTQAASLPSKFRILVTSRPSVDIMIALDACHVKAVSLDQVFADHDIRMYVSKQLKGGQDIGAAEIDQVVSSADGLFEWARLACEFIRPRTVGETVKERFDDLMARTSQDGATLLDKMYTAVLESAILYTLEPLPMNALHAIRMHFPHNDDHFSVTLILDYMGSLLSGVTDHKNPVRLLHSLFHDFLTDQSRSGDYFVGRLGIQADLAVASLCVLHGGLCFNICGLESSYMLNSGVPGLAERVKAKIPSHLSYSCLFWSKHLQATELNPELAGQFEVLSLLGILGNAAPALSGVARWCQGKAGYEDVTALARDGVKFIHNFSSGASASTPHLYISALPFTPRNAIPYKDLRAISPCIAKVAEGHDKDWPAAQVLFQRHTDNVTSVAFSPDGTRIVSGSDDRTVRVWDADGGVQIGSPLHGHTSEVMLVAFSSDGTRIVSGSYDSTVRIWDADRGVQIGNPLQGHTEGVRSVAFSPDGTRIVFLLDGACTGTS
ncbi:hypothetical protein SCLCIDRAFT_29581 [Scleroderma citrinum Foug A]|uniref:NACHT domain-containing protein n=1 Tax=Scleroderma citrinum Foug A TaxID=1036808 RepID=A0A0C3D6N4_9AGAM|nr:hypothetical protein SCLCIDRAFT_29581 [Scleroderma citrinum Foug A]